MKFLIRLIKELIFLLKRFSHYGETDENVFALWDEQNQIYLAQKNNLIVINSENLKEIMIKELSTIPTFLLLTQRHIIVHYANKLKIKI